MARFIQLIFMLQEVANRDGYTYAMMGCYWVHTSYYWHSLLRTGAQMPHAADWPMPPTAAVSAIIKRASIFSLPQGNASDDGLHLSTYIRYVCTPYGDSP